MTRFVDVDALAALIGDGLRVALPPDYSGVASAVVQRLALRGVRDLRLLCVPQGGYAVDLLIGAGCVASVETAAVTMGELGLAPAFTREVRAGRLPVLDATCPAIHAGLRAAERGVPFLPIRGILGSDLLRVRPDWQVIDNPFATGADPIVVVPAIQPDVSLLHVPVADREGNVWVGVRREMMTMAHAARCTLVSAERIVAGSLLDDERTAAGTIPGLYVNAIAEAPGGAWPLGLFGEYAADHEHLRGYVAQAASAAGSAAYLADLAGELRRRSAAA